MKSPVIKLLVCFICSILVIVGLFAVSRENTHRDNGFYRLFPPHPVTHSKTIDLKFNSYYIAGTDDCNVYLGNYTAPLHLLKVSLSNLDTTHIRLYLKDEENRKFHQSTRIHVLAPYIYILEGVTPQLFRGRLGDWKLNHFIEENNAFFIDAKPIGPKTLAIQAISNKTGERILGKITGNAPHLNLVPGLLEKQIDGIFCTDGKLYYNNDLSQLIYVYNYRNQFLVMDSVLNLVYKGKTIDTTSQAKIKTYSMDKGKSKGLASKPMLVNRLNATSGDYLFVNSTLMAKNQRMETFQKVSTIDIYHLVNKSYEFSFYIPSFRQSKLSDFIVKGNNLIAIQNNALVFYNIAYKSFHNTTTILSRDDQERKAEHLQKKVGHVLINS